MASELEFYVFDEPYDSAREKVYKGLEDRRLVHRGLPHPPDHQGGGPDPRDPERHGRRRHPGRVLEGRMGPGPGRAQPPLRRGARDGRPPRRSTRTASRRSPSCRASAVTFMAKWDYGLAGSSCHIHTSLVDAEDGAPAFPDELGRSFEICSGSSSPASWRSPRDITLVPRALHQLLQALPGRLVRADQGDLEHRQSHRGLPGGRRRARRCGSSAGSRAPTPTPISPSPRCSPPACTASSSSSSSSRRSPATPTRARTSARCRRRCARRSSASTAREALRAAFGDAVVEHYLHCRPLGAARVRPPDHRPRADPRLRARLSAMALRSASPAGPRS